MNAAYAGAAEGMGYLISERLPLPCPIISIVKSFAMQHLL